MTTTRRDFIHECDCQSCRVPRVGPVVIGNSLGQKATAECLPVAGQGVSAPPSDSLATPTDFDSVNKRNERVALCELACMGVDTPRLRRIAASGGLYVLLADADEWLATLDEIAMALLAARADATGNARARLDDIILDFGKLLGSMRKGGANA